MKQEPEKPHTQNTGTLTITPISGNLKDDGDTFTSGDPFVKVKVDGVEKEIKPHSGGGKKPKWTEEMTFERKAVTKMAEVCVMDDDPANDDLLGKGEINIAELCGDTECEKTVTVALKTEDGDANGTVDIKVKFSF